MDAHPPVLPIIPIDLAGRTIFGQKVPKPSLEHSITRCQVCGGDGWIGPAQLFRKSMVGGFVVCYRCVAPAMRTNPQIHALDATADDKPRRT